MASPFVARLQRTTSGRDICALIRRDGLFHLERKTGGRFEALEGVLDDRELADVTRALNDKDLAALAQKNITVPLVITEEDVLQISILRSPFTQNLTFLDRESRRPFDKPITPLLDWLDVLRKHSHTTLDEYSGRNNCMPPRKTDFSARPTATSNAEASKPLSHAGSEDATTPTPNPAPVPAVTPKPDSFVMRWQVNHIARGTVQDTCVVVYPSGRYRMEKSSQGYSDKLKVRAFEDSLGEAELKELQGLLDGPELKTSTHQNFPSGKVFREGEVTTLVVAREGHLQRLSFASYFGVPGWLSNVNSDTDPEARVVAPLRKWVHTRVEGRKTGALKDASATHCSIQSQEKQP